MGPVGCFGQIENIKRQSLTIISGTSKGSTSVTEKYETRTKGYSIYNNSSRCNEDRKCLTTRKDGNISVVFGEIDDPNYSGYLHIETHV